MARNSSGLTARCSGVNSSLIANLIDGIDPREGGDGGGQTVTCQRPPRVSRHKCEESMHGPTNETELLARQVLELVLARQRQDPWPLGGVSAADELAERVGPTITAAGL